MPLAASAGLALLSTASIGLLARLWAMGSGLRGGTVTADDLVVATVLLAMWPLVLVLATTHRTAHGARLGWITTVLLTFSYVARASRPFNFISLGHLCLYLGLFLVVTLTLSSVARGGQRVDRSWLAVTGCVAVPSAILLAGELPPDSLVVAAMVVSALALVAIGISRPRVLLAGAVLSTPLFAAGFGQLLEAVTIHDPRPGRAVAEIPLAIAIVAVSLLPTLALMAAGSAVTLRQSRRGATSPISTGRVGW